MVGNIDSFLWGYSIIPISRVSEAVIAADEFSSKKLPVSSMKQVTGVCADKYY